MNKKFLLTITLFALLFSSAKYAQQISRMSTDRPDKTESPFTVPMSSVQIEMGFTYQLMKYFNGVSDVEIENFMAGSTLIRYGINDFAELRFGGEFFSSQTTQNSIKTKVNGIKDLMLGAKINIRKDEELLSNVGIIAQAILPFGNEKLRPNKFAPKILVAVDQTITNDFSLAVNFGLENNGNNDDIYHPYSGSLSYQFDNRLGAFVEVFGTALKGEEPSNNIDCGITYLLKKNIQMDFVIGTTLMSGVTDFFGGFGFSIWMQN